MRSPGVHHFGLTVSDLDRSVRFYARLGFEEQVRVESVGDDVGRGSGVPGAHMRVVMLARPNALLELIEYAAPPNGPAALPNNGIGAAHVCIEVEDIDAAVGELAAEGVEFLSDPIYHDSGVRWVYCKDPDGITAELLEVLDEA